jgi:hypothetical protein
VKINLARLAHKLYSNPETSRDAKRLSVKADPTLRFPELETEDMLEKSNAKLREKQEELEQQLIQQNAQRELDRKHQIARERGLDPAEVEKAVIDHKIYNWDSAMQFVEMLHQSAPATPDAINGGGNSTQMPTEQDEKELWANPAKWAEKQAHAAIDELNAARKRRANG